MLLIETYIDVSPGKGIGLFAMSNISKGQKYWIRNEIFDKVISDSDLNSLEKLAAEFFKTYGFLESSGNWYLCGDHARFSNHSNEPNTKNHFDENGVLQFCTAITDIQTGEEILIDYTEICITCRHGVSFAILR